MRAVVFLILIFSFFNMNGQDLPYQQIPEYPEDYSAGNVVARMIDGLGYRYYWASKDLSADDLNYKPSEDGRTSLETLQHIYGLSLTILNAPKSEPNVRPVDFSVYSYEELREMTLKSLKEASELVAGKTAGDFEDYKVIFKREEKEFDFPFWNMINGPIADAIYHTGQLVIMRRASGNPIDPNVNVFMGVTKEN